MGDLSKNFSQHEFKCPCGCGFADVDMVLVDVDTIVPACSYWHIYLFNRELK